MEVLSERRKEHQLSFLQVYMTIIERDMQSLRENVQKIFSNAEDFKLNLWHNFACNFRDPSFCDLILNGKIEKIWKKLTNIVNNMNILLEQIHDKSKS